MKILQLNLQAFGPFTNEVLEFPNGSPALHLVYGPNEAGKSTALRALRGFFYGIESRSGDNFIHPYPKLRIGATLQAGDGSVFELVRRKGRSNTLRDGNDDVPVNESVLATLLGGVDEASFQQRYGIGYDDLVRGGRELVTGGGDLGHSLFAAASGVANLSAAQTQLVADSAKLFLERGSKPEVNKSVGELAKLQKQIKADMLPTAQWRQHDRAHTDALKRRDAIRASTDENMRRQSLLRRIARAIPVTARREQILSDLRPLAEMPLLSEEFAEQRRQGCTALEVAQQSAASEAAEIAELDKSLAELQMPSDILQHAAAVTHLQQRMGAHLKAMDDRRVRVAERNAALASARAKLQELGREELQLEEATQLLLTPDEHVRIANLGNEKGKLVARVENAQSHLDGLAERRADVDRQLSTAPATRDSGPLRIVLTRAREAGPLETQLDELRDEQQTADGESALALKKLRCWSGSLNDLEQLALPAEATIDLFEQEFLESKQALESCEAKRTEASDETRQLDGQIEKLRRSQDVPTEDDLTAARRRRDRGWDLLARQLVRDQVREEEIAEFVSDFDGASELAPAYVEAVTDADQIADRLRREAKQVAEKAQLLTRREMLDRRLQSLNTEHEVAQVRHQAAQDEWMALWRPLQIAPLSPREMHAWLRQAHSLSESASAMRARLRKIERLKSTIDEHRTTLVAVCRTADESHEGDGHSLAELIRHAEETITTLDDDNRQRIHWNAEQQQLQRDTEKGERALGKATRELERWANEWSEAISQLQLRDGAEPAEANAAVEAIKTLLDHNKDAQLLDARIASIDRDAEAFRVEVEQVCSAAAGDLVGEAVEQAVPGLADLLRTAQSIDTRRTQIEKQLATARKRFDEAERNRQQAAALLNAMCAEAGCERPEELSAVERDSANRRALEHDLRDKVEQLTDLAAGQSLSTFVELMAQSDGEQVAAELRQLETEFATLGEQLSEIEQAIGEERNQLAQMDGNARAAGARQEVEQLLAKIRSDAEQYARLRLADVVLATAIERYRQRHQGPVLERASELFATLTLERFSSLRADLDDAGKPVLVGVRGESGEAVYVDGMSDGTCDQLYLALRLASLESDFAQREPLPFVVDDVLIKFDDDRAAATLKVLAALSEKTQVIMFTHHEHLVRLAEEALDDDILRTHLLDSRKQPATV